MAVTDRDRAPPSSPRSGSRSNPQAKSAVFACNGEYWTLGYGGVTFPLKDIKGLSYIQRLLQHPGEEFHSLDLLSGPGSINLSERNHGISAQVEGTDRVGGLGDSGPMLDARAKQEYKRKLHELNEELEDQRERGNHQRAERIESEIDFLNREIARAVGLGGRDRRAGSASERARLNVTRAIKGALQKISEQQTSMGDLLGRSIRTGQFCSYTPDPRDHLTWEFSVGGPEAPGEVASTVPFISPRETGLLRSLTERTVFVGREAERSTLRHFLDRALCGEGRVVMIGGAAGVGKTRVAQEFGIEASLKGFLVRAGSCYDRGDSVPFIPFVEILEETLAQAPSPKAFRESLGNDAAEIARLLPQLRRLFPDIPPPLEIPAEQSRRLLFNAAAEFLARTARIRPVVLVFDDLQWADEGTSSLLSYLAPLVPKMPVLIVGTYRDSELDPTRPLVKTLDDLIRLHVVEQISLGGLPQNAVAGMLLGLSGREPPETLVNLIYSDTEGNPFFVEELFHHLVEQGKLIDSAGEFRRDLKIEDVDVPRSLRLVIGRRLARLSGETQKILAAAAVIGRSFTFELLEASMRADPDALLERVEEAEKAGLIYSTLEYPETRFHFSHELIRQAVVSGLSAARRQRLHLGVADAIERVYSAEAEDHANDLVHHLWQAGKAADINRTARYLEIAAKQAIARSASVEAITHLTKELALVQKLPHNVERDKKELFAQSTLGIALQTTKGYAAPEVDQAFTRAHQLAEQVADTTQLVSVLRGQAFFCGVRADYLTALKLGQQMLRVSEQNPEYLVEANLVMGLSSLYLGELSSSRAYLERGIATEIPQGRPLQAIQYAGHSRAMCLSYLAPTLWLLGYPDQALQRSQEGLALAQELSLPMTLAQAQGMHALLYQDRRDLALAQEWSDKTIAYASEHGFSYWFTLCSIVKGWVLDQVGQPDTGVTQFCRGLDGYRATGAKLGLSCFLALLAELHAGGGRIEDGLRVMREAQLHIDSTGEQYYEAEVHRLNGEIVLRQGGTEASHAAEACFLRALEVARRQGAKAWELRTATSLARLWREERRPEDARELVTPVFTWFTEGFSTPDLQDAKRLIDELDVLC